MPGAPIFDEWSTPDVQDWLNTPLIIVAVIAILGVLWGVVLFIWKLARWTSKVDTGEQDFRAFTKEIRDDMRTIRDHVVQILARIPPSTDARVQREPATSKRVRRQDRRKPQSAGMGCSSRPNGSD